MATQLENLIDRPLLAAYHNELMTKTIRPLLNASSPIEGYMRVAGSSDPALSYKHYEKGEVGKSVFSIFYPCLVGTKLTGDNTVGKILHTLQKLGARKIDGVWKWLDLSGTPHAIDGSEGDVMIVNTETYHELSGKYEVQGVTYDVFLRSMQPFEWNGYKSTEIAPFGMSPDYCVSHTDTGNVTRMHSVYNPAWNGSYSAPVGVVGKYIFTTDEQTGDILETYDDQETLLGGAGGCHSTDINLYDGEQRAMNNNVDTTKTFPWMNDTARSAELLWANMVAETGTFDSHKASMFGSGFSSNDAATASTDWDESASGAKNGVRLYDKDNVEKRYSLGTNAKAWSGGSSDLYLATMINSWRNPFKIMEAYRVLCYAMENEISELTWFTLEGNKYKWRSIPGMNGPAQGEATAVVFKMMSSKMTSRMLDPTDKETSLEGNRIDFLVSVALYHGKTTQVSPSWWTSGLLMTENENGQYKCYMERDQTKLLKSVNGDKVTSENWPFETSYKHVLTAQKGEGYRKNYNNDAFMLPDTNDNKTGAGLHTYVCAYNWFTGSNAGTWKKSVRGFRRGTYANDSNLSPLTMFGYLAPSHANRNYAFGTCVRIVGA